MDHSKKMKVILISLCVTALAILIAIGFVIWDYIEKSKWTYEYVDIYTANELQEQAAEFSETWLRDPKLVAERFFVSEGYGESVETKQIKGGSKKVYVMKNAEGQKMKAEVLQPDMKGEFGIWIVKRYILDPPAPTE